MKRLGKARELVLGLFEDDDPKEPGYDPVQLGASIVVALAALGGLYWLLWTLLVYEGGLFLKLAALLRLLFTSATLRDLGYEGSYAQGAFEGWFGNVAALAITVLVVASLRRLYRDAARKPRAGR
ncbi:MAG: hypothetical protein HY553_11750 [Elusimicrobia bacterium]|nr:hypothetical protein [Elusimicrobiota bacterium]